MQSVLSAIPAPAYSVINDVVGMATEFGFDRVADLMKKGDWKSIFSMTPETSSYVGFLRGKLNEVRSCFQGEDDSVSFTTAQKISEISDKLTQKERQDNYDALGLEIIKKKTLVDLRFDVLTIETLTAGIDQVKERLEA